MVVHCGIASLPERMNNLRETVFSIYRQVDKIHVVLQNYKSVPSFLDKDKIQVYHSDNSRGAAMKCWGAQYCDGYYFSCDDDLVYPADYVETMVDRLKAFDNRIVVTAHGGDLRNIPVKYDNRTLYPRYHFQKEVGYDRFVMFGGTGVMAFYQPFLQLTMDQLKFRNMVDVDMFHKTQNEGVPVMVVGHKKNWIKYQQSVYHKFNIYREKRSRNEKSKLFADRINMIENPILHRP